jgi:TRAP-type C4-dicarboxylate transport system permease large subunit
MLVDTAALSGAILFIIGTATGMSWALTQSGFSHALAEAMTSVPGGKYGFLLVSIAAFIVLGSVLEASGDGAVRAAAVPGGQPSACTRCTTPW